LYCFLCAPSLNLVLEMTKLADTLTKDQIEEKVRNVVVNYLQVDAESVKPDSHFVDDLGADSLDLTEIAIAFEDAFALEIPDSDFGQLSTIAGVVAYIQQRLR
jgi:acyl carrier protein